MSWISLEQVDHGVKMWATLFKEIGVAFAGMVGRAKNRVQEAAHRVGGAIRNSVPGKSGPGPQGSSKPVTPRQGHLQEQAREKGEISRQTEQFLGKGAYGKALTVSDMPAFAAHAHDQQMAVLNAVAGVKAISLQQSVISGGDESYNLSSAGVANAAAGKAPSGVGKG